MTLLAPSPSGIQSPVPGATTPAPPSALQLTIEEAVRLGAADGIFYSHFFFPKTFRQQSPEFHRDMWTKLEDPSNRYVAFSVFRDGAKTTIIRSFASKMIAYGFAHTILSIGKSESAALRTARWLMKQVMFNRPWAGTFGLRKGEKWTEQHFEVLHSVDEYPISVLSFGITGSIRGVNLDDYRPDLIFIDDTCDTDNTSTQDQLEKTKILVFSDIQKTLAPRSEAPHAKMCLLQTPNAPGDVLSVCLDDPEWTSAVYGCFDETGKSRWEARWPTQELLEDKQSHIHRNQLSLWMRDKECKIISSELSAFKAEHVKSYENLPLGGSCIIAIDPASSDSKEADDTAMAVVYFYRADVYLLDYRLFRGYDFDFFAAIFFEFIRMYHPRLVVVEDVAYQRTLLWHLRREMENRRIFVSITPVKEHGRKKSDRLIQSFAGLSSQGHLYAKAVQTEFFDQFAKWGPTVRMHDDLLDAISMAIAARNPALDGVILEGEYEQLMQEENGLEPCEIAGAP